MSEIKSFVTLLGNPIIASIKEETASEYALEHALLLSVEQGPNGLSVKFAPLTVFSDTADMNKGMSVSLNKSSVIFTHNLGDDLKAAYCKTVGLIITPGVPKIQLG